MRIDCKKNKCQYYLVDEYKKGSPNQNGRYIKQEEKPLVRAIAQRDYDKVALKKAKERLRAIEVFMYKYSITDLKELYNRTHPQRRILIETEVISDEEYIRRWESVKYNILQMSGY